MLGAESPVHRTLNRLAGIGRCSQVQSGLVFWEILVLRSPGQWSADLKASE